MKYILFFIFSLFCLNLSAQNLEKTLILKDEATNLPIADATVLILRTKQILLSNIDGLVSFSLKSASSIQISHPAYRNVTIRSLTLKEKQTIILLKSNVNELDEFIISKQHPQKVLKNLIESSKNKLTIPSRLKVYCREFFKLNGDYNYYNDGLVNFEIFGKTKNFDTKILVEQNRSYGLINEEITADVLGYNLNDIMENYYNFKYLNPVLDSSAKKDFDFIIKVYSKNKDYYIMTITPNDESKGLLDNFSVIYDNQKKMILEVSSFVSNKTLSKVEDKKAVGSKNIFKSIFKTIYRFDNNNYYLVSSREEIGFDKIEKDKTKKIEVINNFLTSNFSTQNYSFKPDEVFKDKTLFNKKNTILSDYWSNSGLVATDEEREIILKLDEKD